MGLVSPGQGADEVVGLGGPGGGDHVVHRGVGAAEADVVGNAGGEEESVLKDEGHLLHQGVGGHVPHVRAAHPHAAGVHIPEARDEAGHGALAGAGRADQGGDGAGGCGEAHVLQGRDVGLVGCTGVSRCSRARYRRSFGLFVVETDVLEHDAGVAGLLARGRNLGQ